MVTFRKNEMIEMGKFYEIFCKTTINSHCIHSNDGNEIGLALDLGMHLSLFSFSFFLFWN